MPLMLSFLRRLFGGSNRSSKGVAAGVVIGDDLRRIERELEKVGHGYRAARLLNRAGDLYLGAGDRQNALQRYGDAIDAYLQSGEFDNAMAVCRKIIRLVPEVIRTRRTLAWLCLGKGFLEIAREHIDAYAKASIEAGLQPLAVQQLQLMAQYVAQPDFRAFLGEKLTELGAADIAAKVREGAASNDVRAAGWTPVIFAALLTPEELRQASDKGVEIQAPTDELQSDQFDALLFDPEAVAKGRRKRERPKTGEGESGEST